jgi:hypothetical protein
VSDFIPPNRNPPEIDPATVDEAVQRSSGTAGFGMTPSGYIPKPFARLLAEKLALAQGLMGENVDLTSGSPLRKIIEVQALEDARFWAVLAGLADDAFVATAQGDALSRHGEELGLPRPYLAARGTVTLALTGTLPQGVTEVTLPLGARMLTEDRAHHVYLDQTVRLSAAQPSAPQARVVAFYPGPDHNLDPALTASNGVHPLRIRHWNEDDVRLANLRQNGSLALVAITHDQPLRDGEQRWPDRRYRQLLLQAPRSLWTVDAIRVAVSLVPGVRRALVRDMRGGLDLALPIFGQFSFSERVFGAERDLASPYFFQVLVAPGTGAFWDGPDGLLAAVASAIEDLRPISIYPEIIEARQVAVSVSAQLVVRGIPLPAGSSAAVNTSEAALEFKRRLLARVRPMIEESDFGEPVRAAEITWALMSEPGVVDVRQLRFSRFPSRGEPSQSYRDGVPVALEQLQPGENVVIENDQVAVLIDDNSGLVLV